MITRKLLFIFQVNRLSPLLVLFTVINFPANVNAQQRPPGKYQAGFWINYQLRKAYGKKVNWVNELQLSFQNTGALYDNGNIRTGIQYEINKHLSVSGFVLFGADNLNQKQFPVWRREIRPFQDIRYLIGNLKKIQLVQLIRLEERFSTIAMDTGKNEQRFAVRFRYRAELRKAFNEKWKAYAGNEVMYQHANNLTKFNQYRAWLGAGFNINPNHELQVHVMQVVVLKAKDPTIFRLIYQQRI